jgi:hypothetical protein
MRPILQRGESRNKTAPQGRKKRSARSTGESQPRLAAYASQRPSTKGMVTVNDSLLQMKLPKDSSHPRDVLSSSDRGSIGGA